MVAKKIYTMNFIDSKFQPKAEIDVQFEAANKLSKNFNYIVHNHKCGIAKIDKAFPSKNATNNPGSPDLLLCCPSETVPVCVWENKGPDIKVTQALQEAKFYIEGLFKNLPNEPALPRLAAGYNGHELLLEYYTNECKWVSVKYSGQHIKDHLLPAELISNGINNKGEIVARHGWATASDLRDFLPAMKNIYRYIPSLTQGRKPIDFTIAILTIRMLVERNKIWGKWSEQPYLSPGSATRDHAIRERYKVLADRILSDRNLKIKYGEIFEFKEKNDGDEISFSFIKTIDSIPLELNNFVKMFDLVDTLPPLEHADFDIFGEVYQAIGDNATKKALGQFFTGRHVISSVLPILMSRSGLNFDKQKAKEMLICDPACGTGGFLTEFFRVIKSEFDFSEKDLEQISRNAFYGFDLSYSNASRASVNMYFAGDGFSRIEGGFNSLDNHFTEEYNDFFDFVTTNPPYGKSSYGRAEEAFLDRVIKILKPGGWGLIVLPTGVLENPRSINVRFNLFKHCQVTDSISLPKHTFGPYTQQKTSIVIFRKRQVPLNISDCAIDDLIKAIGHEKISFFIVDNDGYANSDKRYATDLKNADGSWKHNDLSRWVNSDGVIEPSLIYNCIINEITPPDRYTEFGEKLGEKYDKLSYYDCFVPFHRDISILADTYLRSKNNEIFIHDYQKRIKVVDKYLAGKTNSLLGRFNNEIEELTTLPIVYDCTAHHLNVKLSDICDIVKGTQGFTEEIIYLNYDPNGLRVYGGGKELTNFKVRKSLKNKNGQDIKIFKAPALVVSMDGSSGSVHLVKKGHFTANHHAAILTPYAKEIDLDWLAQTIEFGLKKEASNKEGSATLTKDRLDNFLVSVPIPSDMRKFIGDSRRKLIKLKEKYF